jgi:hypothetical protein
MPCSTRQCPSTPVYLAHWPGRDVELCQRCTAKALIIADTLGFTLSVERIRESGGSRAEPAEPSPSGGSPADPSQPPDLDKGGGQTPPELKARGLCGASLFRGGSGFEVARCHGKANHGEPHTWVWLVEAPVVTPAGNLNDLLASVPTPRRRP